MTGEIMRRSDYATLMFINLKGSKLLTGLFLIIITFILAVGNVFININYNYNNYMDTVFRENMDMRTMLVYREDLNYEQTIDAMMSIEHVVYSYNQRYNYKAVKLDKTLKYDKNNYLYIKPVSLEFSPKIVKGRAIENEGEIICPMYLSKSVTPKTKKDLLSMESYLEKEVVISYESYFIDDMRNPEINNKFQRKLRVVGLYNNVLSYATYSECYMLDSELQEMVKESTTIYSDNFLKDNAVSEDGTYTTVIVDDIDNFMDVKTSLENQGYYITTSSVDTAFVNNLKNFSYKGLIIIAIILVGVLLLYINNIIRSNSNDIGLYKVFGYKENDIVKTLVLQISFLILISYLISLLFINVGIVVTNNIISHYIEYACLSVSLSVIHETIYLCLIILFVMAASILISQKISKMQIRSIFDESSM